MRDMLAEYTNRIPDGQAVSLHDAGEELGIKRSMMEIYARELGVMFSATDDSGTGRRRRNYIANPKTVKQWQAAQKQKA